MIDDFDEIAEHMQPRQTEEVLYDPDATTHPPKLGFMSRMMTPEDQAREAASIKRAQQESGAEPVKPPKRRRGYDDKPTVDLNVDVPGFKDISRELADLNRPLHVFESDQGMYATLFEEPLGVSVEIDMVKMERGGDVQGVITIRRLTVGAERRLVGPTKGTISGPNGRRDLARDLTEADPRLKNYAKVIIEIACINTIEAARSGSPMIRLKEAPVPEAVSYLIEPVVHDRNPVILFGDGGSGKSYLGMAFAASLASGKSYITGLTVTRPCRVGYLDWEMSSWEHRGRLESVTGPDMPDNLFYTQCVAPLPQDVDRLRRYAREHQIDYWVVDSVAPACGGEPESAEIAAAYFNALRSLGGASLSIAHVSKAGSSQDQKPFGSTFWHNLARLTWFAKAQEVDDGLSIGLWNRKNNLGRLHPPFTIDIDFTDPIVGFRTGVLDPEDFKPSVPKGIDVLGLVMDWLKMHGPSASHEMAEGLDVPVESVNVACSKGLGTKKLIQSIDVQGVYVWDLSGKNE